MRPAASFSTPIGEIENTFIELLGISVGEVMQRLVTDEVLHEADARHIHRLLATNDTTARDAVMQLEQAGGSSSRRAVECFRREVISLFQQELPFVPSKKGLILETSTNSSTSFPTVPFDEVGTTKQVDAWNERTNTVQTANLARRHVGDLRRASPKWKARLDARSTCVVSDRRKGDMPSGDVPVIENVYNHLAHRVAELHPAESSRPRVVLVGRSICNPIHKMHLRQFVIARQYLEERTKFSVFGGLLVPKHATEVRQRCRIRPEEIIPPRHRLAMARVAIGGSPWLTVDSWEITRRRMLDYLSTLDHIRRLFVHRFPDITAPIRFVLLVAPDQLLRLNIEELKDAGHECITICRPQEHGRLLAQMGTRWRHIAHVVEDNALLSVELESTSSSKLRRALAAGKVDEIMHKLPRSVLEYIKHHKVSEKMSGRESWTTWDKQFADGEGEQDRGYRCIPRRVSKESTNFMRT